jgi:pyruvate carboxylase
MHILIDQGKTLIVKLLATGPINQQTGIREVFFELNGPNHIIGKNKILNMLSLARNDYGR